MLSRIEASFPANFAELSLKTLEDLNGEKFQVDDPAFPEEEGVNGSRTETDGSGPTFKFPSLSGRLVKLIPIDERVQVVGVDVTCRRIGKTSKGEVCAVRGAVVWRNEKIYHYNRFGPFVFHLREPLQREDLRKPWSLSTVDMPELIQVSMERELQKYICRYFHNSIILFDGCLSAQKIDRETLMFGHKNLNRILAISKNSKLTVEEKDSFTFLDNYHYPCLLYLDDISGWLPLGSDMLGWVFIAKLSNNGFRFRLDVDNTLTFEKAVQTVQTLIGGDLCAQGYPETLRMAHMLSVLTPSDVIAIQRFLVEKFNLKIERIVNRRRILFGPFARWVDS